MSTTSHSSSPAEPIPAWEQHLEKHFKTLLLVCAAAVVGVGAYGSIKLMAHRKAVAAGEAFAAAKTVEDCDIVLQKYPGAVAAGNALLLKADLLWEQNKKDSAVAALREFTAKHTDHPLIAHGLLALASKLEALGERDEAKPIFEHLVNEFATTDLAPLAQLRLGDLLWAEGKEDDARKAYESVAVKFPDADNAFTTQSETRMNWIAAKLPTMEVEGPAKPKDAAPAAPKVDLKAPGVLSPTINAQPGTATSAPVTVPPMAIGPPKAPDAPKPAPASPAAITPAPSVATPAPIPAPNPSPKPAPAKDTATPEPAKPSTAAPTAPAAETARPANNNVPAAAPKAP